MSNGRFVDVTYCDDIRHEVGNKITLVGCYGPDLHVEKMPVVLAKLCVFAKAFAPVERPFDKLTFRVCFGSTVMAEMPIEVPADRRIPTRESSRWMTVNAAMTLSPFFVETPGILGVEVETEDGLLIGPRLWVDIGPHASPAPGSRPRKATRNRASKTPG